MRIIIIKHVITRKFHKQPRSVETENEGNGPAIGPYQKFLFILISREIL